MIRRLYAWLTQRMVVDLMDFDGDVVRRVAYPTAFGWHAVRVGFGIRSVRLAEGGSIDPPCYVTRWAIVWDYRA